MCINDTDTPEQLHWHGQFVSDGCGWSGGRGNAIYCGARDAAAWRFTPKPAGLRFYHTHNRAGADLHAGQYSGQVGAVYIEPKNEAGNFDPRSFFGAEGVRTDVEPGRSMAQDFSDSGGYC